MSLIDARPHSAAVKAAIKAQFGPRDAYDYGTVPGDKNAATESLRKAKLPDIFAVVSVERRYSPVLRTTAQAGSAGWRVSVRCMGRTVLEAQWAMFHASLALNERRLLVDDKHTTPLQFESDEAPAWDDARFAGLVIFTYAH
ncbi:hypothetical protein LRP67_16245 [Nocardioides sp. cx-169]|uniref:hypothetical protein n=1 Tax=Nocardioides sp. cx-169 TaxID=2899080 RepID=UPI001E5A8E2D|nr:hypothetical protein [Nocardioides sp. cx-169]MCD4535644.1 hypothetical protein [Nocardioides sp. cx-169]